MIAPLRADATCPLTRYALYGDEQVSAELAGSAYAYNPYYPYDGNGTVSWNAPAGVVSASGCAYGQHGWLGGNVWTSDDFQVLGAPPGVPLRVVAALDVSGQSDSGFGFAYYSTGQLSDATGRQVGGSNGPDGATIRVQLELDMVVGVPQRLTYAVFASGSGACVYASARLHFPELPPGVSVISCRGFQTGAVTATRPTSWGKLKQIYR